MTNNYLQISAFRPYLLLMILMGLTTALFGASYQAESPANQLSGAAAVYPCAPCFGGAEVGYIGKGSTLQFNGVDGGSSGTAQISLSYANGSQSTLTGIVN